MNEIKESKGLNDLIAAINGLDVKLQEVKLPEFALLKERMDSIGQKKDALMEKISEARGVLTEKLNEE
jgi:hypothetical protein|tara:strand:+ start:128 stop:331 length:204 start_codon:yes stop_codon:yes gene_type:complete